MARRQSTGHVVQPDPAEVFLSRLERFGIFVTDDVGQVLQGIADAGYAAIRAHIAQPCRQQRNRSVTGKLQLQFGRADQVKTVYLSTGMATLDEVRDAVKHLSRIEKLYLLQCTSQYPTDDENVNLRMMLTLKEAFPELGIGLSDHSRGIDASLAAAALGAEVVEKHFTYHTRMPGDDHEGAVTPDMLAELARRVARIEAMLGSAEKAPVAAEERATCALRIKLREVGFD